MEKLAQPNIHQSSFIENYLLFRSKTQRWLGCRNCLQESHADASCGVKFQIKMRETSLPSTTAQLSVCCFMPLRPFTALKEIAICCLSYSTLSLYPSLYPSQCCTSTPYQIHYHTLSLVHRERSSLSHLLSLSPSLSFSLSLSLSLSQNPSRLMRYDISTMAITA